MLTIITCDRCGKELMPWRKNQTHHTWCVKRGGLSGSSGDSGKNLCACGKPLRHGGRCIGFSPTCSFCGEKGHTIQGCPVRKDGGSPAVQPAVGKMKSRDGMRWFGQPDSTPIKVSRPPDDALTAKVRELRAQGKNTGQIAEELKIPLEKVNELYARICGEIRLP